MADVEKYVDEIDQLTADQGCIGDEHDRWRSSVAAIIRRAQVDASTATWRREANTISNAGGGEQVTVDTSGSDSAAPSSGPAPAPAEDLDAPARHGPGCPEHVAFWTAIERFARAGSNVAARMSAVADVEAQARVWGPLSARYYGATAEPRGCPTPGACSCPPAEPDR